MESRDVQRRLSSTPRACFGKAGPKQLIARVGSVRGKRASAGSFGVAQRPPICHPPRLPEGCLTFPGPVPGSQLTAAGDNRGVTAASNRSNKPHTFHPQKRVHSRNALPPGGRQGGGAQTQQTYTHTFTQHEDKPNKTPFTTFCANSAAR